MSFLNKMANKIREKFDNVTNEGELNACVAACVLIAAADGSISEQERETAFNAIATHESLKTFKREVIRAKFDSDANLINSDRELATTVLEQKLQGLGDITARIRVLGIAKQIANADGEFSDAEKKVVDRIRKITA